VKQPFDVAVARAMVWSAALLLVHMAAPAPRLGAQPSTTSDTAVPLRLVAGRSFPVTGGGNIAKVTVANPEVADVVVIGESEVVINAFAPGETDIIIWGAPGVARRHYRVAVRSAAERRQILLGVKFAEVRRETLRQIGTSFLQRSADGSTRIGTGSFRTDRPFDAEGGVSIPNEARYLTVLSTFNTSDLLGLLEAEEQRGNARFLAEPNLMAANNEEASFLAGGEIPIPLVQGGGAGQQAFVTIQYREFGIRLTFRGEVLGDSLLKLRVKPEVSSLDYANALTSQGFRIPALRTRRVESTVDVLDGRSLIISGLFNEEREQVRTGIPFITNIPILGALFSSTRWLRNESELIVIVSPILTDAANPRPVDLLRFPRDTTLPARPALEKRQPSRPPGS
jgi:pilus assembly protein CpaC